MFWFNTMRVIGSVVIKIDFVRFDHVKLIMTRGPKFTLEVQSWLWTVWLTQVELILPLDSELAYVWYHGECVIPNIDLFYLKLEIGVFDSLIGFILSQFQSEWILLNQFTLNHGECFYDLQFERMDFLVFFVSKNACL